MARRRKAGKEDLRKEKGGRVWIFGCGWSLKAGARVDGARGGGSSG